MFSKREWVIFFAGVQAFHTVSHILIGMMGILPIHFLWFNWSCTVNVYAIVINAIATAVLFWWAERLK